MKDKQKYYDDRLRKQMTVIIELLKSPKLKCGFYQ